MKNSRKRGIYAQHSTRHDTKAEVISILGLDNGERRGWPGWNSSRLAATVRVPLDTRMLDKLVRLRRQEQTGNK